MKISLLGVLIVIAMMVNITGAEVLYTNDFGTEAQLDAVNWVTNYGAGPAGITRYGTGTGVMDLDGDGLYEMVVQSTDDVGWGGSIGTVVVYAPLFSTMTITDRAAGIS